MLFLNKKQYKNKTTEELVVLSQNDNLKALEELIKRNQDNVYATFYYLGNNCEDISDLTQEALLKVAKNIKKLKDATKFKSWLNKLITRQFYDYIRNKNTKPQTIPFERELSNGKNNTNIIEIPCKKCTPEEKTLHSELNCLIEKSIQKLPNPLKLTIVLRDFQGLTYDEIADITNTNVGTVKSRISRARNKLQEDLKLYIA